MLPPRDLRAAVGQKSGVVVAGRTNSRALPKWALDFGRLTNVVRVLAGLWAGIGLAAWGLLRELWGEARGRLTAEVIHMPKRKRRRMDALSLDREQRLCAEFDSTGLHSEGKLDPKRVVVDDCPEEHIM